MKVDPEYLREHYGSLSDEALLDIDHSELTEMAQLYYDPEINRRGLKRMRRADTATAAPVPLDNPPDDMPEAGREALDADGKQAWLADAAEAFSVFALPRNSESRVADACEVLDRAGIPCYSEKIELSLDEREPYPGTHRWRIMVPGNLNWRAMSTLERDISNPDFEAAWKAFLEAQPERDLPAMHPKLVFCGLFDRIDRVTRVYQEELARRRQLR